MSWKAYDIKDDIFGDTKLVIVYVPDRGIMRWVYETPDGKVRGVATEGTLFEIYRAIGLKNHRVVSVPRTGIEPMLPD